MVTSGKPVVMACKGHFTTPTEHDHEVVGSSLTLIEQVVSNVLMENNKENNIVYNIVNVFDEDEDAFWSTCMSDILMPFDNIYQAQDFLLLEIKPDISSSIKVTAVQW